MLVVSTLGKHRAIGVGIPPEEFVATFVRFVTSVVTVPIVRIFSGELPADGEETCIAAWEEPREEGMRSGFWQEIIDANESPEPASEETP